MRCLPVLVAVALGGCGAGRTMSPPPSETHTTMRIEFPHRTVEIDLTRNQYMREAFLAMSADDALLLLPDIYETLGIEGGALLNDAELIFGARGLRAHRRVGELRMTLLLDCGSSLLGDADSYHISLSVLSAIEPHGEASSTLRSWVQATGRQDAVSSTAVTCSSTGRLEREIEAMVKGARAGPPST
jgi:hypothetical protein